MNSGSMTRQIALPAVIQLACIFGGFFALGIVLKVLGYPASLENQWIPFSPLAVFLREKGLFFLLFPMVWCIYGAVSWRVQRGWLSPTVATVGGVAVALCILLLFVAVAIYPLGFFRS